ncbi:MAG: DUF1524 domain-containing protein [Lactobacillaceae bacterium]|jgi:hypothetical protein|nr:DUF1524 domain-containing protein [Lactobacillaceae bacterium]
MSIRDFQIKIKNDLFVSKLNELVSQGIIKDIIQVAKDALLNEDVIDVPPVLVKDLIKKSPDLFLFLLSWIRNNGRPRNSAHVLGKMFVFSWFKLKKASVLFENKENLNSMFWEESIKKYITNDVNSLRWLVSPKYLRELYLSTEKMWDAFYSNLPNKWHPLNDDKSKIYLQYQSFSENSSLSLEQANIYFEYFFTILRSERRLLYFSQRRYLNDKFKDYNSLDGLEDTNRPWDIDHIYPKSWKNNYERHHKVKQPFINDWIGTNGNFRAISLTDNRSENNLLSPGERLDSPVAREQAFITDKQWSYWSKLDKATRKVYMDNAEGNKNFFYAIVTRILDIYEEFWNTLQLDKLMD